MNWGLPIEPISIPHFKNNTGKRLVRTVCITGNDIDITPNTGEAVTLVIKRQGVRAKMRTPCVYLVYCTCVKTAFNQTNSDANWTPQRMPSSNALRSCSVQSLMIMKNIALFVSRGSASKYTPSCANSNLISGGSLSLDSQ